jgi:hypothetical protein
MVLPGVDVRAVSVYPGDELVRHVRVRVRVLPDSPDSPPCEDPRCLLCRCGVVSSCRDNTEGCACTCSPGFALRHVALLWYLPVLTLIFPVRYGIHTQ